MVLGREDRAPLVCGRGINVRFAHDFVKVCLESRGVIEIVSEHAVPPVK